MWRNSGECAPVDGDQEMTLADEAAGATSVDVAADADPASDQDPEADGGLKDGLAPTDPVAPPMSVGRRQPIDPTEAERIAHNRTHIPFADWCESCVRGRGCDDPQRTRQDQDEGNPLPVVQCDYFFLEAEKKDILCKAISAIDSVNNRTMALECEFKGLSDQAVPKQLREYLKSLGFKRAQVQRHPEGALKNVLDHALHGLSGWTRRQSPLKDKPTHGRVERFHATLEGLMRTWRNDVTKRYGVSLPAHHPTVAWLVRHCAWLHDRFVMKRQDQQSLNYRYSRNFVETTMLMLSGRQKRTTCRQTQGSCLKIVAWWDAIQPEEMTCQTLQKLIPQVMFVFFWEIKRRSK